MDAMEAILTRRSVREFSSRPIEQETLEKLLRAGTAAPSAGNEQPWHFVTITDRSLLLEIPKIHPYAQMVPQAAAAILVCGDPALQKYEGYMVQDLSAASQNILLAARALGLGSVWLGIHPIAEREQAMRKLLGIPDEIVPMSLLALGYTPVVQRPADRYRADRAHSNRW